jgi:hypothetical protein
MNIEVLHCSGIFRLWLGFREKTDEKNTITKIIVFFDEKCGQKTRCFLYAKLEAGLFF